MRQKRLFLVPYACSGFAALVYELAWTRLLTLYMGHGTAAASTKAGLRARLSIKPSAAVRALLRRHKIERIAVHLDFDPGASGTKIARSLSLLRSAHRS